MALLIRHTRRLRIPKKHAWTFWVRQSFSTEPFLDSNQDASGTGLPIEQRCKNILAGNWRCQLTTVDHLASTDGREARVSSMLATYAAPRGLLPPIVLLQKDTDGGKIENLEQNSLASMTIGRTDPPGLVSMVSGAGMQLPCLSLLGDLRQIPSGELGYILRRAQNVYSRLPGFPTDWERKHADGWWLGYSMAVQGVKYIDMTGQHHTSSLEDLDAAFLDPLAAGQARLLGAINGDLEQWASLQVFCAAYMQTEVRQAVMTQADRRGFTILAQPTDANDDDPWREFRFVFNTDISDSQPFDGFMTRLQSMRQEAEDMVKANRPNI